MNLELATAEQLLSELVTRYTALVVLGVHKEDVDDLTTVVIGPTYMCMGLVHQCGLELTNSLQKPEQGQ